MEQKNTWQPPKDAAVVEGWEPPSDSKEVKKKDDSGVDSDAFYKEQSVEPELSGRSEKPFSAVDLPQQRTPSLSDLHEGVSSLESELASVKERIQEEEDRELSPMERQVGNVQLSTLKQQEKDLKRDLKRTMAERNQMARDQALERRPATEEELSDIDRMNSLRDEVVTLNESLKEIGAAGLFDMPLGKRIRESKEGQERVKELETKIRAYEDAQRADLRSTQEEYGRVSEDVSNLMGDIVDLGYDFEQFNELFEGDRELNETEQRLVDGVTQLERVSDDIQFRINNIGENFTTTSDMWYHNWMTSMLGTIEGLGTYLSLSGNISDSYIGESMANWAEGKSGKHVEYVQPFLEYSQTELGDFKIGDLGKKTWWTANGGQLAGSMTFFTGVGALAALTANPIVAAAGWKGSAAMWGGGLITSTLSSPILASIYGGQAYKQVYDSLMAGGAVHEDANEKASTAAHKTFSRVLPVSLALNTGVLGLGYKNMFTQPLKRGVLGAARDKVSMAAYSGFDNWWQENTVRYYTELGLDLDPTGLFAMDAEAFQNFISGSIMSTGTAISGSGMSTIKGMYGAGNRSGYERSAKPFMQSKFALQKDMFSANASVRSLIKQGRMTESEGQAFLDETQALIDNPAFQRLTGQAAVVYAENHSRITDANELLSVIPDSKEAQKMKDDAVTMNDLLVIHSDSGLNVVIQDGEVVALDANGEVVHNLTEKQQRHVDEVKKQDETHKELSKESEPSYRLVTPESDRVFATAEEFLNALRESEGDMYFTVMNDMATDAQAMDLLAEKDVPVVKLPSQGEDVAQVEIVAQEGDKTPLTESEAIQEQPVGEQPMADIGGEAAPDVSSQEALKDVESTAKALGEVKSKKVPFNTKKANEIGTNNEIDFVEIGNPYIDVDIKDGEAVTGMPVSETKSPDNIIQRLSDLYSDRELQRKDFTTNELVEINEAISFLEGLLTNNQISEAYHAAKADGSNPQLVQAVESLLGQEAPKVEATQEAAPKEATEVVKTEPTEDAKPKTLLAQAQEEGVVAAFAIPDKLAEARKGLRSFFEKNWKELELTDAQLKKATTQAMTIRGEKSAQNLIERVLKESEAGRVRADKKAQKESIAQATKERLSKAKPYKDAVTQYEAWKKDPNIKPLLKGMPKRVADMIERKALKAIKNPDTMPEAISFFEKVLTNQDYANQINEIGNKLSKQRKAKTNMGKLADALYRIRPKARYFLGRNELGVLLGKMDLSHPALNQGLLNDLDNALDALAKKDVAPILEFVHKYRNELRAAEILSKRGVNVKEGTPEQFNKKVDRVKTLQEALKKQIAEGGLNVEDVQQLNNELKGIEDWISKHKTTPHLTLIQEGDVSIFQAESTLKEVADFLNNGYKELAESARNEYEQALDEVKKQELTSLRKRKITVEGKELQKVVKGLKENADLLMFDFSPELVKAMPQKKAEALRILKDKAKYGRGILDEGAISDLNSMLETFESLGYMDWVKFHDIVRKVHAAAKGGLVMNFAEQSRGITNAWHKRKVVKISDSVDNFRSLYSALFDNRLGFDGVWNSPYWEAFGYKYDNAVTSFMDESELETKVARQKIYKALDLAGKQGESFLSGAWVSSLKGQLHKALGGKFRKHLKVLSRVGMVHLHLDHYVNKEIPLRDIKNNIESDKGKFIVRDNITREVLKEFDTKAEAQNYVDQTVRFFFKHGEAQSPYFTNKDPVKASEEAREWVADKKELYADDLDVFGYAVEQKWNALAKPTSSAILNKMMLRADQESYNELKGDAENVVVKTMKDAERLLTSDEFAALKAIQDVYSGLRDKAKISTERRGKEFAERDMYGAMRILSLQDELSAQNIGDAFRSRTDKMSKGKEAPGFIHERQKKLQGYPMFNALDNLMRYTRDVNAEYHIIPVLEAEIAGLKAVAKHYDTLSGQESLVNGEEATPYTTMRKFVDNILKDRVARYNREMESANLSGKGIRIGSMFLDTDTMLRKLRHVSKAWAMVDVTRPILDGVPQIVRMIADDLGLKQLDLARLWKFHRIFAYLPEGSAMDNVGKVSMTRYDLAGISGRPEAFNEWATNAWLAQPDRLTKQMGWMGMFDKVSEQYFGEKIDTELFMNDSYYRNTIVTDPLFQQAIQAADKYVTSTHFARTLGSSRGAMMGNLVEQGSFAYKWFSPLASYQLQALQRGHISVMNTLAGPIEGVPTEARRALGVALNNLTYAMLSKANRILAAFVGARRRGREDEIERLEEEWKMLWSREGILTNLWASQLQIMVAGAGSAGSNALNVMSAAGENWALNREKDLVKKREMRERISYAKDVSGTGYFPMRDWVAGNVPWKQVVNTFAPVIGDVVWDIGEGIGEAASRGVDLITGDSQDLPAGHDPGQWKMLRAAVLTLMLGTGASPGIKNANYFLRNERRFASRLPYSNEVVKFLEFSQTYDLIEQTQAIRRDDNYTLTSKGELKYRIPKLDKVMTSEEIDKYRDSEGNLPSAFEGLELNSFYQAEALYNAPFTLGRLYDFAEKPLTYGQFQGNYETNIYDVKLLENVYEQIRTHRRLDRDQKYEMYDLLDREAKAIAEAIWKGEAYASVSLDIAEVELELRTLDQIIELEEREARYEAWIEKQKHKKD